MELTLYLSNNLLFCSSIYYNCVLRKKKSVPQKGCRKNVPEKLPTDNSLRKLPPGQAFLRTIATGGIALQEVSRPFPLNISPSNQIFGETFLSLILKFSFAS